jgi:Protein of unknown function (DUF2975)
MPAVSVLPKLFHWLFAFLEFVFVLGVVVICAALLVNPKLPAGTHFGPMQVDLMGQPGTLTLRPVGGDSDFTVTALRGSLNLLVKGAGGLIEVAKQYGLPLILIKSLFLAVLFELLRRLFRNVGRGESFTRQTVSLVQIIGGSLLLYSLVTAVSERCFFHAVFNYVALHSVLTISGTELHLPQMHGSPMPGLSGNLFDSPIFFSGLLVLALSEVFRQGLALKNENDLTV